MTMRRYAIPSLMLAGFVAPREAFAMLAPASTWDGNHNDAPLHAVFKLDHIYTLAGHSSHSSHASHSSGSGGGYVAPFLSPSPSFAPAPVYTPPPNTDAVAPLYSAPPPVDPSPAARLVTLPGNSNKFIEIVIEVQTGLIAWGYFSGPLTGIVDGPTRAALLNLQKDWNLKQTGTITPEVLNSLKIVAR